MLSATAPVALAVLPVSSLILSPAFKVRFPPVDWTVTPELRITSSPSEALSVAVATKFPALLVLAAKVSVLEALRVVVVPLFAELAMPPTELIVNDPSFRRLTAPPLLMKDRFETNVFTAPAAPIPVPALIARFVDTTSATTELVPLTIAPEAVRVTVFPGAPMAGLVFPPGLLVTRSPLTALRLIAPLVVVAKGTDRLPPAVILVALIAPVPVTVARSVLAWSKSGFDELPNEPLVPVDDRLTTFAVISGVDPVWVLVRLPLTVRRKAVFVPTLTAPMAAPPMAEIHARELFVLALRVVVAATSKNCALVVKKPI
jgi:hypothetical protein